MTLVRRVALLAATAAWAGGWVAFFIQIAAPCAWSADATSANSSRAARDEAIRSIPWRALSPADRADAQFVVKNASMFRRLPTRVIDCDPDMFTFLVRHPEVIVDVWQIMGISRVKLDRLPDGVYRGSDGAGTSGNLRYLYTNWGGPGDNFAVVFADGAYDGQPLLKPIRAQTLMLIQWKAIKETNGRHYITVRADSFVHVEQLGIELVAKTVQPWISKTADQNFIETLTFVSNFSRTAEQNPQGMQRLAMRLTSVDAPIKNELVEICYRTAQRHSAQAEITPDRNAVLARFGEIPPSDLR